MRSKKPEQAMKMLDAAAGLFGTQRFHQVRMEDVAARAGVGKGTIYRYFEDKDELYLALLERAAQQIEERIPRALAGADSALAKLEALMTVYIDFFTEQPHIFDMIQRADALRGEDTPWRTTRDEAIRLVRRLLDEGNQRGEFSIADPELASLMILGSMRAVIRFGPKPHPPRIAGAIVRSFLFGASKPRGG